MKKWDLIKLTNFLIAKETIIMAKRQPAEGDKIFTKDATDKGLTAKIYKQFNINSTKQQPNREFRAEDHK